MYPAFTAKGCVYCENPDTLLFTEESRCALFEEPALQYAEDNLSAEHINIEDWFRGYCGSPGLGGPRASGQRMRAGLVGRHDKRT